MRNVLIRFAALACLLAPAWPAASADGVIELSQACAVQTGCVAGDAPGYPITLDAGSYVLTSNLRTTDVSQFGISLTGAATIDFNGFHLRSFSIGGTTTASGITSSVGNPAGSVASGSTIRNGTIDFFRNNGIFLPNAKGVAVENMVVRSSVGGGGILVGENARLVGNRVFNNNDYGIRVTPGSLVRDNLVFDTTDGPDLEFAQGAIDYGGNICEDESCQRRSYRRYYLTDTGFVSATSVPTACAAGYHLASLYELAPGNALQYNSNLGDGPAGNGDTGPPAPFNNYLGWHASGTNAAGDTCSGWSTNSSAQTGRAGGYTIDETTGFPTWRSLTVDCDLTAQVWCIED